MWTLLTVLIGAISGILSEEKQPCEYYKSVELIDPLYTPYASLVTENETIVDVDTGATRGCVCLHKQCSRKCCPPRQVYNVIQKQCVDSELKFNPPVWEADAKTELKGFNVTNEFIIMYGKMVCNRQKQERRVPVLPASNEIFLMKDGNLLVHIPKNIPEITVYGPDKYCIDTFVSDLANQAPILNALICFVAKEDKNNYALSSSCMFISCFFILLTVAVYAWLPELRNLHGMVLMAYLLSFFVGFLFLGSMQILILMKNITQNICTGLTFIIYFALLSAFFWLNVMCYDIWWTFSGKRAHGRDRSSMKRFIHYAIYAFGVPTALTILLAVLEFAELPIQHALLPKLRLQGCFLYGPSKLLYLYVPIVMLCIANMTFFTLTAIKIWKIKKETNMALNNRDSSTNAQNRNDTQRFTLYIKLFTVMGINWILEVISSFYPNADFFWQFSDAYNVLVGLIIFIIFVCKKKTYDMIMERIKDIQRSNSDSRQMKNVTNPNIGPCQTNAQRNASLNTVKTFVSASTDSRKSKLNDENTLRL